MKDVLVFLFFMFVIIAGLWLHSAGPCELYRYSTTGDVPARCLMGGE